MYLEIFRDDNGFRNLGERVEFGFFEGRSEDWWDRGEREGEVGYREEGMLKIENRFSGYFVGGY